MWHARRLWLTYFLHFSYFMTEMSHFFRSEKNLKTRYLKELLTYLEPLYLFYCNVNKEQKNPVAKYSVICKSYLNHSSPMSNKCNYQNLYKSYTLHGWMRFMFFATFAIWMHCYSPKIIYWIAKKRNCIFKWFCHFECSL